jgi:hypothetical protein
MSQKLSFDSFNRNAIFGEALRHASSTRIPSFENGRYPGRTFCHVKNNSSVVVILESITAFSSFYANAPVHQRRRLARR